MADVGGADGAARDGEARDDAALDAEFRQLLAHHLVVEARDLAEGLFADVAAADGERRRNLGEQREVELGVTDTRGVVVRQEVAREGRVADDVRAACVQDDVAEAGDAALCEECLCLPLEAAEAMTEPVRLILHKDEAVGHARNLVEAEIVEEARGGAFRVEEEVEVAALEFLLHQVANDAV